MHIVRYGAKSLGNYSFTMPSGFASGVDIYVWGAGGGLGQNAPNISLGTNIIAGSTPLSTTVTTDTTWVVPSGVSSVSVILSGAGGGSGGDAVASNGDIREGSSGFAGHRIQGELNVKPGQTITLRVGTGGKNGWKQAANGDTNAEGGVGIYNGGTGGAIIDSTTGGTGGGGGAASAILLDGVLIAVAGGGGGGGGAGNASVGTGQVSGTSSTPTGGTGADAVGNTGASAGGGGGGYLHGGVGGTSVGSYHGAASGANGQNLVPVNWTLTPYGGSIGTPSTVPEDGALGNTGKAVLSWSGLTTTVQWATTKGGKGGAGGYGGFAYSRVNISEGDTVTIGIGGPGVNGLPGPSLMVPDYRGGAGSAVPGGGVGSNSGIRAIGGGGGGATVVLVNSVVVAVGAGGGGGGAGGPNGSLGGNGGAARETGKVHVTAGDSSLTSPYTGGGGGGGYYGGKAGSNICGGEGGTCYGDYVDGGTQFAPGGTTSQFYSGYPTATPGYPGEVIFIFHRRFNIWKRVETIITTGLTQTKKATWNAITDISTNVSNQWKTVIQGWIKKNGRWIPLLGTGQPNPTATYIATLPTVNLQPTTLIVQPPRIGIALYITQNTLNYNLAGVLSTHPSYTTTGQGTDITLTIQPGVVVGSNSTTIPSLNIAGLTNNDRLTIINNGTIIGRGGNGGTGGSAYYGYGGWSGYSYYDYNFGWNHMYGWSGGYNSGWWGWGGWTSAIAPTAGGAGGPALKTSSAIQLQNNGIIGGGGGGGGGGAHHGYWGGYYYNWYGNWNYGSGGGGGGGGAGYVAGGAGTGGVGHNSYSNYYWIWWGYYNAYSTGGSGGAGGTLTAGAGGTGTYAGGAGGGLGVAGAPGVSGAGGGAPGSAIIGHSLITYVALGDIRGTKIG